MHIFLFSLTPQSLHPPFAWLQALSVSPPISLRCPPNRIAHPPSRSPHRELASLDFAHTIKSRSVLLFSGWLEWLANRLNTPFFGFVVHFCAHLCVRFSFFRQYSSLHHHTSFASPYSSNRIYYQCLRYCTSGSNQTMLSHWPLTVAPRLNASTLPFAHRNGELKCISVQVQGGRTIITT